MFFFQSGTRQSRLSPANAQYLEEMFAAWKADPDSVEASWQAFFEGFDLGLGSTDTFARDIASGQNKVRALMEAYRKLGHRSADRNPLQTPEPDSDLALEAFGLVESDLDSVFNTGDLAGTPDELPLREIIDWLHATYCRSIGVEYLHVPDEEVRRWFQQHLEPNRSEPGYDGRRKQYILGNLVDAEVFESFLHSRYPGQKRFSLEGAESTIPGLRAICDLAPDLGIEEIVIGMAHRGRLNVLANVMHKSYSTLFSEFEENFIPGTVGGDADVKYHRGFVSVHTSPGGKDVQLSLTANPSHLEAVNPVVEGRVRAKQRQAGDEEGRKRVIPLLIHGDAAFAGQGLVAETLNLSGLPGYGTGGTVHVIINNQIGFTALPHEARSTEYASDVAKIVDSPVFHVNGDDPEAVVFACELALRYRHEFGRDVVVDIICYRRHGHNEGDEPAFTQPLMYKQIRARKPVRQLYTDHLIANGVLEREDADRIADDLQKRLQDAFDEIKNRNMSTQIRYLNAPPPAKRANAEAAWRGLEEPYSDEPVDTSMPAEALRRVARALTTVPEGFNINPKVGRQLPKRMAAIENGEAVDWPFAELLAFGSLLADGTPVRLSGQDSERGTFSQRHSVWTDIASGEKFTALNHITDGQAHFCVYNSLLSEAAVLGFDYGYSLSEPRMLVLWEAQFGDFANGAQVIIDQFISSSEAKWQRTTGLVMLLPHGYEGQGPEHSNAYLERYLQACAEHNMIVCNMTTPANYFHLLRRQMKRNFRRPVVVMAPKSLLRHKLCTSPAGDLSGGAFHELLDDDNPPSTVRRVVLCSGKVYYDLLERRNEGEIGTDVAIVRVEQIYPLLGEKLQTIVNRYPAEAGIVWCQEEPKNRGAWSFMFPHLLELFPGRRIRYVGRPAAASPAGGSLKYHRREQHKLVTDALDIGA